MYRCAIESDGIQHVLLTRLNINRGFGAGDGRAISPAWLEHRLDLFERLAVPAILGQDNQDFLWILIASDETPAPYRERIDSYASEGRTVVYFVGEYSEALPGTLVKNHIVPEAKTLLTSRIDNDDVVSTGFIGRVRREAQTGVHGFINFDQGYRYDLCAGRLYEYEHTSNPFISLAEPLDEESVPLTVLGTQHTSAASHYPIRHVLDERNWAQVLHGGNLSNRAGEHRRVSRRALESFSAPGLSTDRHEWAGDIFLDRSLSQARRVARGLSRVSRWWHGK